MVAMEGPWVAEGIRAQSYPVAVLVALVPYPQQWELNLATPENEYEIISVLKEKLKDKEEL